MAIDSKGNNHQPKGTSNAGRFAPKAGAGDADDLHEDSFPGMYRPHCMPGNWLGGGFAPPTKDGFDVDPYMRSDAGGMRADADDMAEFRAALPVEPVVMGDRDYGEAAAVRDTKDGYVVDLYSGLYPTMPLVSSDGYGTREEAERAARDAIASDNSVLNRFERESDYDDLRGRRHPVGAAGTAWGGRFVPKAGAGDGDGGHALPFFLESSTITTHRGRA